MGGFTIFKSAQTFALVHEVTLTYAHLEWFIVYFNALFPRISNSKRNIKAFLTILLVAYLMQYSRVHTAQPSNCLFLNLNYKSIYVLRIPTYVSLFRLCIRSILVKITILMIPYELFIAKNNELLIEWTSIAYTNHSYVSSYWKILLCSLFVQNI